MGIKFIEKNDDLKPKIINAGFWYFVGNISNIILGLVKLYIMGKIFEPHTYGIYSITLMIMTLINSFTTVGARDYLIKTVNPDEKSITTAFSLDFYRGIFAFFIMLGLASPISNFYGELSLKYYLMLMSLSFLFTALRNINLYKLYIEFEAKKVVIVMQLPIIIINVLIICFTSIYKSILVVILLNVFAELLITIFSYIYYYRAPKIKIYKKEFKEQFSFASQLYLLSILAYILRQVDYYFVSIYFGLEILGLYTLGFRIINIVCDSLLPVIINVFFPLIAKSTSEKRNKYLITLINGVFLFFIVFGVNIYYYMDDIINFLFKSKWNGLYELLVVFIAYSMVRTLASILGIIFKVNSDMKYDNIACVLELIAIGITIFPLAHYFNIYGVVCSITTALFIRLMFMIITTKRLYKLNLITGINYKIISLYFVLILAVNWIINKCFFKNGILTTMLSIVFNLSIAFIIALLIIKTKYGKKFLKY